MSTALRATHRTSTTVLPAGLRRGWIEFRNSVTNPSELSYSVVGLLVFTVSLWVQRDREVEGAPIGLLLLPGALAVIVVSVATLALAAVVTGDRESGVLLRAATVPNGLRAYLTGQVTRGWIESAAMLALFGAAGSLLVPELRSGGFSGFATVVVVLTLGIFASVPLGIAIGALFTSSRAVMGWGVLVTVALVAVSGLFYPLAAMPRWTQVVGQFFPVHWIGHGVRSGIGANPVMEVGGEFRVVVAVLVLLAWAAGGSLLALVLLRRAARRESGSALARRRAAAALRG